MLKLRMQARTGRRGIRLGLVAAIVAAIATLGAVAPAPASAHDACVGTPLEPSVACVRHAHKTVDICDRDADGHWVWAEVYLINLGGSEPDRTITVTDTNGSTSGCGHYTASSREDVGQVRVAVQYEGYGPWLTMTPH